MSAERQHESVLSLLIALISLILEGRSVDRKPVDENKTELNALIADITVERCRDINTTVVAITTTRGEIVVSNHLIEKANLEPCYREEADDRMLLHAKELSRLGFRKLTVVSVDSYWHVDVDELWVEFGLGKDRKWLPIHIYAKALGEEICMALPFWYAFTGCDTVSQFSGREKKIAWKA